MGRDLEGITEQMKKIWDIVALGGYDAGMGRECVLGTR